MRAHQIVRVGRFTAMILIAYVNTIDATWNESYRACYFNHSQEIDMWGRCAAHNGFIPGEIDDESGKVIKQGGLVWPYPDGQHYTLASWGGAIACVPQSGINCLFG